MRFTLSFSGGWASKTQMVGQTISLSDNVNCTFSPGMTLELIARALNAHPVTSLGLQTKQK